MRVLHAIRSDGFAGVERHVARLATQQAREGDEVIVIGGDRRRMSAALSAAGGRARWCDGDGLGAVLAAVVRLTPGADVLHVHMTAAELAAVARRYLDLFETLVADRQEVRA